MKKYLGCSLIVLAGILLFARVGILTAGEGDEALKERRNAAMESGDVDPNADQRFTDEFKVKGKVEYYKENLAKPAGRAFKPFKVSLKYAFVAKNDTTFLTDMTRAGNARERSRNIFVELQQNIPDTAASFPLRAKGNLGQGRGDRPGRGQRVRPFHWEAKAKNGIQDGGVIISFFANGRIKPVRPAGMVARLYPKQLPGFNPSDEQIIFDFVLSVKGALGDKIKGVLETAVAVLLGPVWGPGVTVSGYSDFTNSPPGGLTAAEREYLTLIMLTHSPNKTPPPWLAKNFKYPSIDHRLLNELRFKYTTDGTVFDTLAITASRLKVGATPFEFPKGTVFTVTVDPLLLPEYSTTITIPNFARKVAVTNNLIVKPPTGILGGKGKTFIESDVYVRAGPTLRPYENFLLTFPAPPFFSELRFNVTGKNAAPAHVVGHSPKHTWPSHFIYKWNDVAQIYRLTRRAWQTGARGPFPGFISLKTLPSDPAFGPQPSTTHKQSGKYPK